MEAGRPDSTVGGRLTDRAPDALRGHFDGVGQVVRFNWPFYVGAGLLILAGPAAVAVASPWLPDGVKLSALAGLAAAGWWTLASLVVAHWVYDRSDWPRGRWVSRALGGLPVRHVLNVHSGFDETTMRLRDWLAETEVTALDLFDPARMTERSIHRARAAALEVPGTLIGRFSEWPCESHRFDVVCFLLTAHEFRETSARHALFRCARDALKASPASCVLLVEHVRDFPNFVAFGPGFLHFQSAATWRRDWQAAGLVEVDSCSITPFLRLWKLTHVAPAVRTTEQR